MLDKESPAVDAIAHDQSGSTLAIEHTLLQPFVGEREDYERFRIAVEPLEQDFSLRLLNYHVTLSVGVGAIPTGVPWDGICRKVRDSYDKNKNLIPIGRSKYIIPIPPIQLEVGIEKDYVQNSAGKLFVVRSSPPDSFQEALQQALRKKLPKLVSTVADKRLLLLEKELPLYSPRTLGEAIDAVRHEFRELEKIDGIGLADTVMWEAEGCLGFGQVWPSPSRTLWLWHQAPKD